MFNILQQIIGEPRLGVVRNVQYLAMVERDSITNNIMQNTDGVVIGVVVLSVLIENQY